MIIKKIRHFLRPLRILSEDTFKSLLFYLYRFKAVKKNKIVFSNFSGKRCGGSPYYIFEYLKEKYPEWDYVWLVRNDFNAVVPEGARSVPFGNNSLKMIKELATAGVWVDSHLKFPYTKKRKTQLFVETWHGGVTLKADEKLKARKSNKGYVARYYKNFKIADYVLSDSKWFSDFLLTYYKPKPESILEIGQPFTDILYKKVDGRIKDTLDIPKDKKVILYCPTFRDDGDVSCYSLDFEKCLEALNKKTGEDWVFLVRLHPLVMREHAGLFKHVDGKLYDVTSYPVAQDLLTIADAFITDYSGMFGSFMHTKRPMFLFATDIKRYTELRGLTFDFYSLPYPAADSNEQLIKNILNFDSEQYAHDCDEFKKSIGFIERGDATEQICLRIADFVSKG